MGGVRRAGYTKSMDYATICRQDLLSFFENGGGISFIDASCTRSAHLFRCKYFQPILTCYRVSGDVQPLPLPVRELVSLQLTYLLKVRQLCRCYGLASTMTCSKDTSPLGVATARSSSLAPPNYVRPSPTRVRRLPDLGRPHPAEAHPSGPLVPVCVFYGRKRMRPGYRGQGRRCRWRRL